VQDLAVSSRTWRGLAMPVVSASEIPSMPASRKRATKSRTVSSRTCPRTGIRTWWRGSS
jgi:hypothetical protein